MTATLIATEVLASFGVTITARHAAALDLAARGLEVLPLRGKEPVGRLVKHGVKDATTDAATINSWWSQGDWNVGVRVPVGCFVLDVDFYHGGEDSLAKLEERFGCLPRTMTTLSGRGDGSQHLYFVGDGERIKIDKKLYPGIDLRRRSNYLVAAPSIHPDTDEAYVWADESDPTAAPEWIYTALPRHEVSGSDVGTGRARRELSARGAALIETGVKTWGADRSGSGVFWSALWFCAGAGMTPAEVRALAADQGNAGLYPQTSKRGVAHLLAQYRYVLSLSGSGELFGELAKVEAGIAGSVWTGARGTTARLLAEVLVETAYRAKSTTVRLSHYQAMTALNINSKTTVRAARDELIARGLLTVAGGPNHKGGMSYTLVVPNIDARPSAPVATIDRDHDVFTRSGLGKSALLVLRALAEKPGTVAAIVARSGKSQASVYRVLGEAAKLGLAAKDGKVWSYTAGQLDAAADALGATGAGEKTAATVAALREAQAGRLVEVRAAKHEAAVADWKSREALDASDDARVDAWEAAGMWVLESGDVMDPRTWEIVGHIDSDSVPA